MRVRSAIRSTLACASGEKRPDGIRLDRERGCDQFLVRTCLAQPQCDCERKREPSELLGAIHGPTVEASTRPVVSSSLLQLPLREHGIDTAPTGPSSDSARFSSGLLSSRRRGRLIVARCSHAP